LEVLSEHVHLLHGRNLLSPRLWHTERTYITTASSGRNGSL